MAEEEPKEKESEGANEVAKEAEKLKLTLDLEMIESVLAFHDLLSQANPKGRSETRNHSKLFLEFNKVCRNYSNEMRIEFKWRTGVVEYSDEASIKYFIDILEKKIDSGISGAMSPGYMILLDAADEYKDRKKRSK